MVKVLGIVCSLRKGSNSGTILERTLEGARQAGAETQRLDMLGATVGPCDGCRSCRKSGVCHIKDDMTDWLALIERADAIIFSTPVYFWTVPGQTKILIDRLYSLHSTGKLTSKIGAVIAVATSAGHTGVWQVFSTFFNSGHMLAADFVAAFGRERGDVRGDRLAMTAAAELGKQVVDLARCGFKYPEAYPVVLNALVKRLHDIDNLPSGNRFAGAAPQVIR